MSSTIRMFIGLTLGLSAGATMQAWAPGAFGFSSALAKATGDLWLGSLQMTVIPMIFALIVVGIGATLGAASAGQMAGRTLGLFAALLLAAAVVGVVLMDLILAVVPIPQAATHMIRDLSVTDQVANPVVTPAGDWFKGFIPTNPVAAAADGAIAPLVVFSLAFGFAATRIPPPMRSAVMQMLEAVLQTLLVIVGWVLKAAPLGVASLAFVAAAQTGLATAGALIHYALTGVLFCGVLVLLMYPLATFGGRAPLVRFARAAAPAQLVAFSTQSSVGSLPAMVEAVTQLEVSPAARQMVLPLAVSLFRLGSAASGGAIALYVAELSGLTLSPAQMGIAALLSTLISVAAVGLPSQSSFVVLLSPICLAVGAPLEALVLLMVMDSLPDAVRSVANVTADIAVTTVIGRKPRPRSSGGTQHRVGGAKIGRVEPLTKPADD